jgi:hypothetical protein
VITFPQNKKETHVTMGEKQIPLRRLGTEENILLKWIIEK